MYSRSTYVKLQIRTSALTLSWEAYVQFAASRAHAGVLERARAPAGVIFGLGELRKSFACFRDRACLGVGACSPIRVIGVSIREGGMLGSPCALGGFGVVLRRRGGVFDGVDLPPYPPSGYSVS